LLLFDGAHNPAGARALREYLDEFVAVPVTLVFGAMRDKDLSEMSNELFPAADRIILTQPKNARAATIEELATFISEMIDPQTVIVETTPGVALHPLLNVSGAGLRHRFTLCDRSSDDSFPSRTSSLLIGNVATNLSCYE
jgi:hypothetical protein